MWWCIPVIPALGRLRQEDHEFEVTMGYTVRLCLKNSKNSSNHHYQRKKSNLNFQIYLIYLLENIPRRYIYIDYRQNIISVCIFMSTAFFSCSLGTYREQSLYQHGHFLV
jgi:hypothetical protein